MHDPAIKLFGRKISLPSTDLSADGLTDSGLDSTGNQQLEAREEGEEIDEDASLRKSIETVEEEDGGIFPNGEGSTVLQTSRESNSQRNLSMDEETVKSDAPETEKDQIGKPPNLEEKTTLKKPDKILPCPRCNSMDTKFCYYNNYNVNQPRHFCKCCQRYWTAGGTMRNVPVGAGRRRNKSSAAANHNYHHVTPLPHVNSNGKVLSFGVDSPGYDSAVSALHNHSSEKKVPNGDECSSGSSVTVSNSMEEGSQKERSAANQNGFAPQIQLPWPPYPIAVPLYPAAAPFWNCNVQGMTWNPPPYLGKHPRDQGDVSDEVEKSSKLKNGCVLVPKTLRLDDPNEAAKSTIWATLGIKQGSSINNSTGCVLKAFHQKSEEKCNTVGPEKSPVLCANPAALSRSLNFHETS